MKKILFMLALIMATGFSQEIYSDFFDGTNLAGWNRSFVGVCTNQWNSTTTTPINGTGSAYVVNVDCQTIMNRTQNLAGYFNTSLNVSFSIKTVGLDAGDCLNFSYSNGSTWTAPLSLCATNLPYANYTYLLTTNSNRSNAQFSFRCFSGATAETCQVDNFRIHGTAMGEAPPADNVTIITFNYPADASTNTTTQNIQFGYTPIFYGGKPTNCSLYTNRTGTWSWTSGNASVIVNNTLNTITYNFGADTNIRWSIGCYNNLNLNFTLGNRTLTINTYSPPVGIDYYSGNDPITIDSAMQVEAGTTPLIWIMLRNSSGVGQAGQSVSVSIYDANRNERSTSVAVAFNNGIYYYNSHVLSANDNGTFMIRANTTNNGLNVMAIKTFLVRSFGGGSGGLDANQNQTLYNTMAYAQQSNTTLNKSTDQSIPYLQQINTTLNKTIDLIPANVWAYGTRTLSDYSGVWAVASRTLSDYSGVWSAVTRTLSAFDFKVVTSGGNITNITSPVYCANCSAGGTTANEVWTYANRNLTQAVGTSNLTYCGAGNSNLTTSDIWQYGTRELTAIACGSGNSNLTANDVWGATTRTLTQVVGVSNLTSSDIWNYEPRNVSTNVSTITASDVWNYLNRSLTQNLSNPTTADIWNYATRTLTQGLGNSNLTAVDVWTYGIRELTTSMQNISAADVWSYSNRTITSGGFDNEQNTTLHSIIDYVSQINTSINQTISPKVENIVSDVWGYSSRGLTNFDFSVIVKGGNTSVTNITLPYCIATVNYKGEYILQVPASNTNPQTLDEFFGGVADWFSKILGGV